MKNFNIFKAFNVSLLAQISLQMYFLSMWFCTLSHTSTLDTFCWHLSKDSVICNMFALLKLQFFICFLLLCVSLVIHFINSCKVHLHCCMSWFSKRLLLSDPHLQLSKIYICYQKQHQINLYLGVVSMTAMLKYDVILPLTK